MCTSKNSSSTAVVEFSTANEVALPSAHPSTTHVQTSRSGSIGCGARRLTALLTDRIHSRMADDSDSTKEPSSTSVIRQVVPKAQFFEDIPKFVKESGKGVDELLGEVNGTLQRYRHVEQQLQEKKVRLTSKKPEIEKCLDAINLLIEKRDEDEDLDVDFSLADQVYARAKIQKDAGYVGLWLGAGVMVEYGLEEAKGLLEEQLVAVRKQLEDLEDDWGYVADQTTTTQVRNEDLPRVLNDAHRRTHPCYARCR